MLTLQRLSVAALIIAACGDGSTPPLVDENGDNDPPVASVTVVATFADNACSVAWRADVVDATVSVDYEIPLVGTDGSSLCGLGGCVQGTFTDTVTVEWVRAITDYDVRWNLSAAMWDTSGVHRLRSCAVSP